MAQRYIQALCQGRCVLWLKDISRRCAKTAASCTKSSLIIRPLRVIKRLLVTRPLLTMPLLVTNSQSSFREYVPSNSQIVSVLKDVQRTLGGIFAVVVAITNQ